MMRSTTSAVHSCIFFFGNPQNLDAGEVFKMIYGKNNYLKFNSYEPQLQLSNFLNTFGIWERVPPESILGELIILLNDYFEEANLPLPPTYTMAEFVEMFFVSDDGPGLLSTFLDLYYHHFDSFTWLGGVENFQRVLFLWEAEVLSPPPSPIINEPLPQAPSPASVFQFLSPASSSEIEMGSPVGSPEIEMGSPVGSSALALIESPLDQFSIHPILDLHMGNYYFSFTNPSLSMLLTLGLVLLLLSVVTKKGGGKSVPNAWQSLVELIYDFVPNLVNEQIGGISGNVKQKFFPCISVTFTFSLFRNPQGMIPFSFTVTSHFLITLALSFSIFIGITIVGFQRHGLHFFSFLLPAGVPLPLAPFLVLLELISHCFRALSSGIRLFANMMAGHSSVKILSGFAWTMLFLNNIFYFIGDLGPLFIVLALTGLELGVAISQAHVSTISICIYLNDATNLHQNE